mgnify:CR=1 FL=1
MRILPKTPAQQVQRLTTLVPAWAVDPGAIGLSPERIAEIEALLSQARAAQLAAYEARNAAQAATHAFEIATAALVRNASSAIGLIKATASASPDPAAVLLQAQLPDPHPHGPASPGSLPPPGTPTNFRVELLQTGSIVLSWKCDNPAGSVGTMYQVRRCVHGTSGDAFEHLALCGEKTFTDNHIPVGAGSLTYEVTAFRSTRRGQPARFNVNFGAQGPARVLAA